MNKKAKSLKYAVTSIVIFAFFAIIAWAALYATTAVTSGKDFIVNHIKWIVRLFTFQDYPLYLANTITICACLLVWLVAFIVTLILSIKKKRGIMVLPLIALLLGVVAVSEFFGNAHGNLNGSDPTLFGYIPMLKSTENLSETIVVYCILVCSILGTALAFVSWILAFVHTVKYKSEKQYIKDAAVEPKEMTEEELEDALEQEDVKDFSPEPEVEELPTNGINKDELREIIREIIREELAAHPANNVTGATFNAPLVVQYFNGVTPSEAPKAEPVKEEPKEEVEPEAVVEEAAPEEVKEEPAPEVVSEPVVEPEPVVEQEPVVEEKAKIVRIPFPERLLNADEDIKKLYNEIKNEIMSYGVHSRLSNSGDTFRLHCKTYVKLTIAGKSLKLYFALDPKDYENSPLPIKDASDKNIYVDIPLVFKVKSGLSVKRCKQLIADVMGKDGLEQGEVGNVDYFKEIEEEIKEGKQIEDDGDVDDED